MLEEKEVELGKVENALEETETALEEAENVAREAENAVKEMLFELLDKIGEISEEVCERIRNEYDINILKSIHKTAIKSNIVEQFEEQIANLS